MEKETDGTYLGFLNNLPDHGTQGENFQDLKVHLRDLYHESSTEIRQGSAKKLNLNWLKRKSLIKQLEQAGCVLLRHGARHDIYYNTYEELVNIEPLE